MIDINKAEEWHSEIADLLRNEQLLEALKKMKDFSDEVSDWNLRSELENMTTTYQSMLQCIRLGMEDPKRIYMYRQLLDKGLVMNDRLYRALGIQIATAQYYRTARDMRKHPAGNSLYDLPTWVASRFEGQQASDGYGDVPEAVFNLLWTSDIWSPTDRESLVGMVTAQIPDAIAAIAVSATTLGLMEMYDPQKYLFLFDIYQIHSSIMVKQRAIVGIALGCLVHDNRMCNSDDIGLRVDTAAEDPHFVKELQQVQMYLLRQRETEKISKFMNEEFLPEMMKNPILKSDKTGLDSLNIEDNLNPEWEKWIESKDVKSKMNIMNQLYTTGADIHMASFANMKNFPFFRQVCNWFIPFDHHHPAISSITPNNTKEQDSSFFRLLIEGSEFCDSDCYSLYLFLANLPQSTRENMLQHIPAVNEEMREQLKELHAGHNSAGNLCKKYVQNIYRFYKLYAYRHEFTDIFTNEEMNLQYCDTLLPIVDNPDFLKEVALYLFTQKRYEESDQMYSQLEILTEPQAEILQKRGFCMQQLKRYDEAIIHYENADMLQPSHLWTLTHMAQCLYANRNIEKAAEIYLKAEALSPDDLNLQLQTGNCLAQLEHYEEAFKRFFKVHYLDENSVTVWRAIAWYSLMAGRIEQAERFYNIIEHSDTHETTEVDLLNIGHMHWLTGRTAKALHYYNECCQKVGEEAFREMMKADGDSLLLMGYPLMDLPIVLDLMHQTSQDS